MPEGTILYLIRHGIAAERGPDYPDDAKRPLTREGKARLREIGTGLVNLGVAWDAILTSPFVRARETAEVLASRWSPKPPIVDVHALAVGGRGAAVLKALESRKAGEHLALVGHMPGIGLLAATLVGASQPFDFRKGAVACVSFEEGPRAGAGTLLWFAPPRLLRSAGR